MSKIFKLNDDSTPRRRRVNLNSESEQYDIVEAEQAKQEEQPTEEHDEFVISDIKYKHRSFYFDGSDHYTEDRDIPDEDEYENYENFSDDEDENSDAPTEELKQLAEDKREARKKYKAARTNLKQTTIKAHNQPIENLAETIKKTLEDKKIISNLAKKHRAPRTITWYNHIEKHADITAVAIWMIQAAVSLMLIGYIRENICTGGTAAKYECMTDGLKRAISALVLVNAFGVFWFPYLTGFYRRGFVSELEKQVEKIVYRNPLPGTYSIPETTVKYDDNNTYMNVNIEVFIPRAPTGDKYKNLFIITLRDVPIYRPKITWC
jgi:hypothetical protein